MTRAQAKAKRISEYKKQYRRIAQAVRRMSKKGYIIEKELLPLKPSELTNPLSKDIKKLEKITPQYIREHSAYRGKGTAEITPPQKPHRASKKRVQKEPPETVNLNTQIISDITALIDSFRPAAYWPQARRFQKQILNETLSKMWADAVNSAEDTYALAARLENNAEELHTLIERVRYDSGAEYDAHVDIGRFAAIIFGAPLSKNLSDFYDEYAEKCALL